jgi:hypothetical protein
MGGFVGGEVRNNGRFEISDGMSLLFPVLSGSGSGVGLSVGLGGVGRDPVIPGTP